MIKACIFDLDGTLLDTLKSIRFFLNKTLDEFGIPNISEEQTKVFVGDGALKLVRRAMRAGGIDTESLEGKSESYTIYEKFSRDYNENPYYLTQPYEGIPEAVSALRSRGIKLAIISNKPKPTVVQLVERHFPGTFDIVEGAVANVPLKPDPTALFSICTSLGVAPDETAYFGDTSTDMKTAKNYGAGISVGVLWGFRGEEELRSNGADITVASPSEITEIEALNR